ncbi:MAG TPA: sigma-70 family RNA polymerase sigma factor, partial [Solirubrobacter sp.]
MAIAPAAAPPQLDSRAWEQCVVSLHRELGRIASREDCQDAVQDACAAALARSDLSVENLPVWVLVIARRRLLDRYRERVGRSRDRRKRRRFVSLDDAELAEARIGAGELAELLEDGASLEASEVLRRLSVEQQRLLTLALERTRYPEVAAVLGISPKAAKARTLRAWGALREAFIATERDASCASTRGLLVRPRSRGSAGAAERQVLLAHLETCGPCRAYQKRLKGLIATTPAPSLPFWQQLLLRLEQFLIGAPGPRTVESAAASALTTAGPSGALPRMLATLCATATAAVCALV